MINSEADKLIERIKQDMLQAMKAKERTKLDELRSLLARISNAEAITASALAGNVESSIAGAASGIGSTEMRRKQLTLADIHSIITDEVDEMEATLERLDKTTDYAAELRAKVLLIKKYQ